MNDSIAVAAESVAVEQALSAADDDYLDAASLVLRLAADRGAQTVHAPLSGLLA